MAEPMSPERLADLRVKIRDGWRLYSEDTEELLDELDRLAAENERLSTRLALAEAVCEAAAKEPGVGDLSYAVEAWQASVGSVPVPREDQ